MEYRQLNLNEPLKSIEFLVNNMGFEIIRDRFDPTMGILIKNKWGNYFKLLLKPDAKKQAPIVVYSNDCLSDYFNLRAYGTPIIKEPYYTPDGLMIEFTDACGNYYKMLEKRAYEND